MLGRPRPHGRGAREPDLERRQVLARGRATWASTLERDGDTGDGERARPAASASTPATASACSGRSRACATAASRRIEGSGPRPLHLRPHGARARRPRVRSRASPTADRSSRSRCRSTAVAADASPLVLVATGDERTRREVRRVAEEQGFTTHDVRDGVEAVEAALRLVPAAVVLDRVLPKLSAPQVAERLRTTCAHRGGAAVRAGRARTSWASSARCSAPACRSRSTRTCWRPRSTRSARAPRVLTAPPRPRRDPAR